MSAKNVSGKSDILDRYMTPKWCVDQCIESIVKPYYYPFDSVLEPSAGKGVFVDGMRSFGPDIHIVACDIDATVGPWENADESICNDFLELNLNRVPSPTFDLVIGNPPYTYAEDFCRECLRLSRNLIFILRLGFYGAEGRTLFFNEYPPSMIFSLPNRPQFIKLKKSGDSADYGWFCWREGHVGPTTLHRLPPVPLEIRKLG